jgi:transposase
LWREIQAQGYAGSRTLVAYYVAQLRRDARRERILTRFQYEHGMGEPPVEDRQPLSPREVVYLFLRHPADRTEEQISLITDLCARHAEIAEAEAWTQRFAALLRERQGAEAFDAWMHDACASSLREVRQFAQKLRQDEAAVRAACSLEWSRGQVEGQINRLKLVKRSMYGRAKFDLLRQRVLAVA